MPTLTFFYQHETNKPRLPWTGSLPDAKMRHTAAHAQSGQTPASTRSPFSRFIFKNSFIYLRIGLSLCPRKMKRRVGEKTYIRLIRPYFPSGEIGLHRSITFHAQGKRGKDRHCPKLLPILKKYAQTAFCGRRSIRYHRL